MAIVLMGLFASSSAHSFLDRDHGDILKEPHMGHFSKLNFFVPSKRRLNDGSGNSQQSCIVGHSKQRNPSQQLEECARWPARHTEPRVDKSVFSNVRFLPASPNQSILSTAILPFEQWL